MKFYAETGLGACVREAENEQVAKQVILRECGTFAGINVIRKATKKDIAWVEAMGGRVD